MTKSYINLENTVTKLIIVSLPLVLIGLLASFLSLGEQCSNKGTACYISMTILEFPTWIGTFTGVLWGAYLAYSFNRKKQIEDETRKRLEEERDIFYEFYAEYYEAVICFIMLKHKLINAKLDSKVDRAINVEHMPIDYFKEMKFNIHKLNFLINEIKGIEVVIGQLHGLRFRYNQVISLFLVVNENLGKIVETISLCEKNNKDSVLTDKSGRARLDHTFFEHYSKTELSNHFYAFEQLLKFINKLSKDFTRYEEHINLIYEYFKNENGKLSEKIKIKTFLLPHQEEGVIAHEFTVFNPDDFDVEVRAYIERVSKKNIKGYKTNLSYSCVWKL
ncbi:hypothetical protein [Pseudoalteromonas luteoviolacea]|nr:hypothetical protein [Pseudoalteromonas luteoviolacea]